MNLISFQKIPKGVFIFCAISLFIFSYSSRVNAGVVSSYTLNAKTENVSFNPNGDRVTISISTNVPVKFSTLAICSVSDATCSRTTAVKYFTQTTSLSNSISKDWDGKTGGSSPTVVPDGEYKLKLTSKDGSDKDVTEDLSPYTIHVSSSVPLSNSGDSSSNNTSTTSSSTATTTSSTSTSQTSVNDSSSSGTTYVYSSSVALSTYEPISLNVEAGRERIAFLHSPIEFKARAFEKGSGKDISGARYSWTFGDGTSLDGETVSHTYAFPGDYNVVLNSYSGSEEAVDITKVKVVEAKVTASYTDTYLELANQNSLDVNIGGWKVKGGDMEYLIPRDTIISGKGSVKIPRQVLGKVGESTKISVVYPDNQTMSELSLLTPEDKQKIITELSTKLTNLQYQLAQASVQQISDQTFTSGESNSRLVSENDVARNKTEEESKAENISIANPAEAKASRSLMSKLFDFFATILR